MVWDTGIMADGSYLPIFLRGCGYQIPADYQISTSFDKGLPVSDDPATVTAAKSSVDAVANAFEDCPGKKLKAWIFTKKLAIANR